MAAGHALTFRRTTASDAAALFALEQRVATPHLYEARASISEALKEIVENALFLIDVEGHTVGSVSLRSIGDGAIYIGNMAVIPQYRRRGIARAAMTFVLDKTPDASHWELLTHRNNCNAIQLYHSLGFRQSGGREECFENGEPCIRLVRERPSALTLHRSLDS